MMLMRDLASSHGERGDSARALEMSDDGGVFLQEKTGATLSKIDAGRDLAPFAAQHGQRVIPSRRHHRTGFRRARDLLRELGMRLRPKGWPSRRSAAAG